MFQTLLVPLDGSALSESALPWAGALARASGARLVLTRIAFAHSVPGDDIAADQLQATKGAELYLRGIADRLTEQGLTVDCAAPYGNAAMLILDEARIHNADLIVMATHGRTGLSRLLFGSVADQVLRQSSLPVLLVPAPYTESLPSDREPRILVTVDGSTRSEEILTPVRALAEALRARLLLLEVVEKAPPTLGPDAARRQLLLIESEENDPRLDQAEGHLERLAVTLRANGRPVEVHAVSGEAAATIVAEALAQGADLIAMATHGRGGLARLVLGSVASTTLQEAKLPLLLVRPAAMRETTPQSTSDTPA